MEEAFTPRYRWSHGKFYTTEFIDKLYQCAFTERGITFCYQTSDFIDLCANIRKTNNIDAFRAMLDYLMDDNAIEQYFASPYFQSLLQMKNSTLNKMTIADFRKKYIEEIASKFLTLHEKEFITILINDYGFIPDDNFMKYHLKNNYISVETLAVFHEIFEMKKYRKEICTMFYDMCAANYLDNIKKLLDLGYDLQDLYNETNKSPTQNAFFNAMKNYAYCTNIWKFLLSQKIDFHEYEADLLHLCINRREMDCLQLLLNYGADIKSLQNYKIEVAPEIVEMTNLLSQDLDVLKITALFMTSKN